MKTLSLIGTATIALFGLGLALSPAKAVTFDVLDWSPQNGINNRADVFAPTFTGAIPAGASWDVGDSPLAIGSGSGQYKSPFVDTGLENTNTYNSVGGSLIPGEPGSFQTTKTLTLGAAVTVLDFLWASIDSYNTLAFWLGGTLLDTFNGTDIFTALNSTNNSGGFGNPVGSIPSYEQIALVRFSGESFDKLVFSSSQQAFESAFAAPVPLPAALPLFGAALGGLALLRYRRKQGTSSVLTA